MEDESNNNNRRSDNINFNNNNTDRSNRSFSIQGHRVLIKEDDAGLQTDITIEHRLISDAMDAVKIVGEVFEHQEMVGVTRRMNGKVSITFAISSTIGATRKPLPMLVVDSFHMDDFEFTRYRLTQFLNKGYIHFLMKKNVDNLSYDHYGIDSWTVTKIKIIKTNNEEGLERPLSEDNLNENLEAILDRIFRPTFPAAKEKSKKKTVVSDYNLRQRKRHGGGAGPSVDICINGMFVKFPKDNGDCFFHSINIATFSYCVKRANKIKYSFEEFVRYCVNADLNIYSNMKFFDVRDIDAASKYIRRNIILWDHVGEDTIRTDYNNGFSKNISLMLSGGHYGAVKFTLEKGKKCSRCSLVVKDLNHNECPAIKCAGCSNYIVPGRSHKCRGHKDFNLEPKKDHSKNVVGKKAKFGANDEYKNIIIFDFETFMDPKIGKHVVYAVGLRHIKEDSMEEDDGNFLGDDFVYKDFYGKTCLDEFMKYVMWYSACHRKRGSKKVKTVLTGFNSSGFDNHFIAEWYIKNYHKIENIMVKCNNIIQMETDSIKTFDIMRYLPGMSLARACNDFKIPTSKSFFPHLWLDSWEKTEHEPTAEPGREFFPSGHQPPADYVFKTDWNIKEECLKYLRLDVRATSELFSTIHSNMFKIYDYSILNSQTISSYSYNIWADDFKKKVKEEKCDDIYLPKDPFISNASSKATHGGMVYPTSYVYESTDFESILNKKVEYKNVNDYLIALDVVSLYPTAMLQEFPVGVPSVMTDEEIEEINSKLDQNLPCSLLHILYQPPKDLYIPILPSKEYVELSDYDIRSSGLNWTLENGTGWYYWVDVRRAIRHGYQVRILGGMKWEKTYPVFRDFIEEGFKQKKKAKQEDNAAAYAMSKVFLNGLYGKMLQKNVIEQTKFVRDMNDVCEFVTNNKMTDYVYFDSNETTGFLVGKKIDEESTVTKPRQLGGIILAYSREIMDGYRDLCRGSGRRGIDINDTFSNILNQPLYGDTDSFHVPWSISNKTNIEQYIKPGELGMLDNDHKNNGKVIKYIGLAPKTYMEVVINDKNEIHYHLRSKGVPSRLLKAEDYDEALAGEVKQYELKILKRIGAKNRTLEKIEREPFTIINLEMNRTLCNELWKGRDFLTIKDNQEKMTSISFPIGYDENLKSEIKNFYF